MKHQICLLILLVALSLAATAETHLRAEIIAERPHDSATFTQGLYWHNGILYTSSGLYGRSFVRSYNADNGSVLAHRALPARVFAEGITLDGDRLYVLTWRAGLAFVMDSQTLNIQRQIPYRGQGWGLTHSNAHFIMSNGSDTLVFRNKKTFEIEREIKAHNRWRTFDKLNELEFAQSAIWANIWQSPTILRISPENGKISGRVNLTDLVKKHQARSGEAVLNGIAYDSEKDAFWITGKLWPRRYLVRFHETARKTEGKRAESP